MTKLVSKYCQGEKCNNFKPEASGQKGYCNAYNIPVMKDIVVNCEDFEPKHNLCRVF